MLDGAVGSGDDAGVVPVSDVEWDGASADLAAGGEQVVEGGAGAVVGFAGLGVGVAFVVEDLVLEAEEGGLGVGGFGVLGNVVLDAAVGAGA